MTRTEPKCTAHAHVWIDDVDASPLGYDEKCLSCGTLRHIEYLNMDRPEYYEASDLEKVTG